ncbi:MAG TPA: hypothetical protein VGB07_16490 [Blastocatellia bacterium]
MKGERKETAWRKSRKFGDVYGGRLRPKLADNIFNRAHSLLAPSPEDELPILIEENPSKGFFFPVSGADVIAHLRTFLSEDIIGITHVWLRRVKKSEYDAGEVPFAQFICGSGVRVVILYPWPKDLILCFGAKKPSAKRLREYARWTTDLFYLNDHWHLRWTQDALRCFYLDYLLAHEIGHHIDQYSRHWSKANRKQVEAFADHYAAQWLANSTAIYQVNLAETESDGLP